MVGDAKAWAPRMPKVSTLCWIIKGYKSMPPMGLYVQCLEE
ncbi:hypothetical protein [Pseudomonas veronii]|nr:hypothetical protein [Pseudomonas veronii]